MPGENLGRVIREWLENGRRVWLFLDYDGTLAEFASSPDQILPDQELIDLIERLVKIESIRVAVISGRRLVHIQKLLPVEGIWLAGTYGIEMIFPEADGQFNRLEYDRIRPVLEAIKPRWEGLLQGRGGFFLEDKGWALAIHGKGADDNEAETILAAAGEMLKNQPAQQFQLLGGDKFLEIGPRLANKGRTVEYLLNRFPWDEAKLVYVGDDDKDEEAFIVINARGGMTILVSSRPKSSAAQYRLESPAEVRQLLKSIAVEKSH